MPYQCLADILTAWPCRNAGRSAVTALRLAALDGDWKAARTLGDVIASELGVIGETKLALNLDLPAELTAESGTSSFSMIYALGYAPKVFFETFRRIRIAGDPPNLDGLESAYLRFRHLVRIGAELRHEMLKAVLLYLLACSAYVVEEEGGRPDGLCPALQRIIRDAKIVPGYNANTRFEFGEDVILDETFEPKMFFAVAFHELGHYCVWESKSRKQRAMIDSPSDRRSLAYSLTRIVRKRTFAESGRSRSDPPPQLELRSGVRVDWMAITVKDENCLVASFSVSGGLIDFHAASRYAWLLLKLLCVDPSHASVAYSADGIFHVGFLESSASLRSASPWKIGSRFDALVAGQALQVLAWIHDLENAGRVCSIKQDIPYVLCNERPVPIIYAESDASQADVAACSALRPGTNTLSPLSDEELGDLLGAALRCADPDAVRWIFREGGVGLPVTDAALAQLGTSSGLIRDIDGTRHFGATALGIASVIAQLHDVGSDVSRPSGHC